MTCTHTNKRNQSAAAEFRTRVAGRPRSYRTMPTPKGGCWLAATSSGRRVSSFGAAEAIHPEDGRFVFFFSHVVAKDFVRLRGCLVVVLNGTVGLFRDYFLPNKFVLLDESRCSEVLLGV